jgi:single-stranded-DNA-specific exonuclease
VESTGSARTSGEFNIVEGLKQASHYLLRYGGHKQAAGLTLKTESLEIFYESLLKFAEQQPENSEPVLELESQLSESDLTLDTYNQLEKFEPFGVGNPKPVFLVQNAELLSLRSVGNGSKHLQAQFQIGNKRLDAIGFNLGYLKEKLLPAGAYDIAVELLSDSWNGLEKLKLRLIDIKPYEISYQY